MNSLKTILMNSHNSGYIGEKITQLEHFILAAQAAEEDDPEDIEMIVAAFLHDIGHQLDGPSMVNDKNECIGIIEHEKIGGNFLRALGLPERVCAMIEGHVDAKRYKVSIDSEYKEKLSTASYETFLNQGGEMTLDEIKRFRSDENFDDIIKLRSFDEAGKDIDKLQIPLFEAFERYFKMVLEIV